MLPRISELAPRSFTKHTELTERKSHGNPQPSISEPFCEYGSKRNSLRPSCGNGCEGNIWMKMLKGMVDEEKMK